MLRLGGKCAVRRGILSVGKLGIGWDTSREIGGMPNTINGWGPEVLSRNAGVGFLAVFGV